MDRIERIIEYTEGPTVLDLGAAQHDGSAADNDDWLHRHLADNYERVIGVDYLRGAVADLNERGYEFICADVTELDMDLRADTIVAGELIEHIANPGQLLARCHDHLRDGGRVVLSTPNPWGLPVLRRVLQGRQGVNDEHVAWYGPTVLRQLFDRYGFNVRRIETTRRDHAGLTRVAQWLDSDRLGGTTWIAVAEVAS